MQDYISISTLNDFIFCPYSIYLHNIYMDTDETMYHAIPQTKGKIAHEPTDHKTSSNRSDVILSLPVYSERFHIMGKIDVYKRKEKILIERKYNLKKIYRGQIYQLWAQMFCLLEMGYEVNAIAFYEISTNKMIPVEIPTKVQEREFEDFINQFQTYDPSLPISINPNKCTHCIYCNLCDKTNSENVYT
ncbi:type V CRISPR-associated protein Cas4 [Phocaeicola oris]|uniref:type V CRISPR-associated protein Cas4 n=1 Tax=Phocaeicola oris TaxID=2896850 RepID=UPI00234EADAB|nr:type V CRISPR-associated protein Cas4 [Phocaeicola oris]MCE2615801.1 type V CRISPR-associated protein Cas4 [Phocaeicola oris]